MSQKGVFVVIVLIALVVGLALWYYLAPTGWQTIFSTRSDVLEKPANTPEARQIYEDRIVASAEEADVLTIGLNCTMSPLVLKLDENEILKIHNADKVTHTVSFEDNNFFNVSAGDTRELDLMALWGRGAGIYRYKCNDRSFEQNVGVLYIQPKTE